TPRRSALGWRVAAANANHFSATAAWAHTKIAMPLPPAESLVDILAREEGRLGQSIRVLVAGANRRRRRKSTPMRARKASVPPAGAAIALGRKQIATQKCLGGKAACCRHYICSAEAPIFRRKGS